MPSYRRQSPIAQLQPLPIRPQLITQNHQEPEQIILIRPHSDPATPPTDQTNAVLIGEAGSKNIRSGPGVSYGKVHDAFPGDRVVITNTDQDADGYTWYEVSFPKSGAKGWIAAQLVKKD